MSGQLVTILSIRSALSYCLLNEAHATSDKWMNDAELLERQEECDPDERILHWRVDGEDSGGEEDHVIELQTLQAEQDHIERYRPILSPSLMYTQQSRESQVSLHIASNRPDCCH